jgi:hypothetical protein
MNVDRPALSVRLYKNVVRTTIGGNLAASDRARAGAFNVDLTPYITENGHVKTNKSRQSISGTFDIMLADIMRPDTMDSIYASIEPMDLIEIRFCRNQSDPAYKSIPGNIPVVMRGFVSKITRSRAMSADGKPFMGVSISGHDYGKLFEIFRIFYANNYIIGDNITSAFPLFEKFGAFFKVAVSAAEFVDTVRDKIINNLIDKMRQESLVIASATSTSSFISGLNTTVNGLTAGQQIALLGASPIPPSPIMHIQPYTPYSPDLVSASQNPLNRPNVSCLGFQGFNNGSLFDFMSIYGDVGAFNELFVQDEEAGVFLMYRPLPYRDVYGNFINALHTTQVPQQVKITAADITDITLSRSDASVANFYWVDNPDWYPGDASLLKMQSAVGGQNDYTLDGYKNATNLLYGVRKMEVQTHQQGSATSRGGQMQDESGRQQDLSFFSGWLGDKLAQLIAQNKDNVVFEEGSLSLKGNEKIKIGNELLVTEGAMNWQGYVESVSHEYMPFRSFTTHVSLERATSFIARLQVKAGGKSPYLSELGGASAYD